MNPGPVEVFLMIAGPIIFLTVVFRLVLTWRDSPFMILRQFWTSRVPEKGCYVYLAGRPAGFGSWFRSLLGVHTEVRFEATTRGVRRSYLSLSRYIQDSVPLENIGGCQCGYRKSPISLVLCLVFLCASFMLFGAGMGQGRDREPFIAFAVLLFLASIVMLIRYFLSKRLQIAVETGGGRMIGVEFKPSLIENSSFTRDDLEEIMLILVAITSGSFRERNKAQFQNA